VSAKTYKRETAALMLGYLGAMFAGGVFSAPAMDAAKYLTPFIFIFAAGAYGLDALAKQLGGKP